MPTHMMLTPVSIVGSTGSTEIIQIKYEDVFSNTFVSSTFYKDNNIETLRSIYFELGNSYCPLR